MFDPAVSLEPFSADHRHAPEQVEALYAALQQRSAELQALSRELIQSEERERQRVARLLHDDLQQLLVAAHHKLARLRHRLQDSQLDRMAEDLAHLLDDCIRATRSLSVELCPPDLYQHGLVAALHWLARQMNVQHELTVVVESQLAAEPADQSIQILLYQTIRELLFNVVKHAQTDRAWISLNGDGDTLEIEVGDPGIGFDPATLEHEPAASGLGLFSIQNRLARFGGRLDLCSAPGSGTRVTIRLQGFAAPYRNPAPR